MPSKEHRTRDMPFPGIDAGRDEREDRYDSRNGRARHARARSNGRLNAAEEYPRPPFPRQHQIKPGHEHKLRPRPLYFGEHYKPADKLLGKRALITGGDSGIGRAVAAFFAREGADVAINYLPEEQKDAEETQRVIEKIGRRCELLPGDLTDPRFCRKLVDQTAKLLGGLDILVSNAAYQTSHEDITDISDEEFDHTFKVNIYAYFWLVKAAVKHMQPGSAIIVTSSETALDGPAIMPDYAATKGAINTFTKSIAQSLLKKGIRVNGVAPGPVWTPLNASDPGGTPKDVSEFGAHEGGPPMKRPAQPEELAPAYIYLASNADSSYVAGHILRVMGGKTSAG